MTDLREGMGERIRTARLAAGLSVRELARRIGVSPSHVSQVERGMGAFSVPALYAAAGILGVSVHALLEGSDTGAVPAAGPHGSVIPVPAAGDGLEGIVQRAADHPSIQLSGGPRWSRLTAAGEPEAEFLEVVYAPGIPPHDELTRHEGREYGVVIAGRLNIEVDGCATVLHAGDSIAFDSGLPHRFWNDSDGETRAIWFVRDREAGGTPPHL
ncbi:helix-turn-helix domain-containing protein [Microbacterium album]|uniref:XRE family transcriptional regulator n=1 Tax=Microbacterium album TaxID=2053191 RepID=A0A917IF94_9MICO|nr:cupin domain-containing protein [Microbacterium album]GGH43642.1 XRE family transcriptional regulator [Microbacterium album]